MKKTCSLLFAGLMALVPLTRAADIAVTTDSPTGPGSLTAAILALTNNSRIVFNIPPAAGEVHYIQVPYNGFPLITKNDVTIDGYTQAGASPNTATILAPNNAVLKIVITATNGYALSMGTACTTAWGGPIPNLGWGDDEMAILGFWCATNATVQGLCIQSAPQAISDLTAPDVGAVKALSFACNSKENGWGRCQNFRVSGCYFGIDPVTKQVAYMDDGYTVATPEIAIANYRTRNTVAGSEPDWNYNYPGTIGVQRASATPRAEFNCFVTGYGYDSEGKSMRVCGNFWNVLPDGVTATDMSILNGGAQQGDGYFEVGRNGSDILFGVDGDGINDAEERNLFGPWAAAINASCLYTYSLTGAERARGIVIAGNYFNMDIYGNPLGALGGKAIHTVSNNGTYRMGSDFNGVSDDLEVNKCVTMELFDFDSSWPTNLAWMSMRGNSLQTCVANVANQERPTFGNGDSAPNGFNIYSQFMNTNADGSFTPIPVISAATATSLSGTCAKPITGWGRPVEYTRVIVDVYEADTTTGAVPQGKKWLGSFEDNSVKDSNAAVGAFTFNTTGLGITSGKKLTIAVTYSRDPQPTISKPTRVGNQTTVTVSGGIEVAFPIVYGVQKASVVTGPYAFAATAVSGAATFTDNNAISFYRATGPAAAGQTGPFSDVFTATP